MVAGAQPRLAGAQPRLAGAQPIHRAATGRLSAQRFLDTADAGAAAGRQPSVKYWVTDPFNTSLTGTNTFTPGGFAVGVASVTVSHDVAPARPARKAVCAAVVSGAHVAEILSGATWVIEMDDPVTVNEPV
jgi:hypothetical protein